MQQGKVLVLLSPTAPPGADLRAGAGLQLLVHPLRSEKRYGCLCWLAGAFPFDAAI